MPLNDAILTIGAQAMEDAIGKVSLHTAQPDGTGSNLSSAAKQAPTWDTAANGDMLLTVDVAFTGGASGGACTHLGFWDTAGTTWYGYLPLTGDQTFNAAGEYTLQAVTISGSAT
jgi:hypothetical protein